MRVALTLLICAVALVGCATQAPIPSPAPTTSAQPSATPQPTQQSTPTVGPTTDTGLPTSILGLPVYTVAGINQLAVSGALDGRMAAVAGYWTQQALPCAYMPHVPAVLGFCNGGRFGDSPEEAQGNGSGAPAPLTVPETVGGDLLWQMAGPANDPARVALIVHAADARSWQCAPADRPTCTANLVIDRVAWINDQEVATMVPDTTDVQGEDLHLTADEVIAAGLQAGETPVLVKPLHAGNINDVDPRFIGMATGIAWYMRVISGTPDADGIVSGRDVLVDATGAVVSALPLAVDASPNPARLILDASGQIPGPVGQAHFSLSTGGSVVASGDLSSSLAPLALAPGEYTVSAWTDSGAITSPPAVIGCDVSISLAAGDDVSYYAQWQPASDCVWTEGSLFPF